MNDRAEIIAEPGIYTMPADRYHADPVVEPSLSSGIGRTLIYRSPAHARAEHPRLNPDLEPENDERFDLGSAAHALLLEGENRMEVVSADDWRTKAAREARDAARAAGKHPVLLRQFADVNAMVEVAKSAIARCEDLGGLTLADGVPEQTLIWKEGGAWFRARPDWTSHDRRIKLDYKTTDQSANPLDWWRTIASMGYDFQASFYQRGDRVLGGPEDSSFIFMVQEKSPPYAVSFIGLPPSYIALADAKVDQAIADWQRCIRTNEWPAYSPRIHWVEPPQYLFTQWEERQLSHGIPYDPAILFGGMK